MFRLYCYLLSIAFICCCCLLSLTAQQPVAQQQQQQQILHLLQPPLMDVTATTNTSSKLPTFAVVATTATTVTQTSTSNSTTFFVNTNKGMTGNIAALPVELNVKLPLAAPPSPPPALVQARPTTRRNNYAQITALDKEVVERLIKQWAPVVWLAPEEKFLPLGVEEFLNHVHPIMEKDKNFAPGISFNEYSTKSYLVTNADVDDLLNNENSFLYGRNPNESPVPIYGVVTLCTEPKSIQQPAKTVPELIEPIINVVSSTRAPYIPVSIDPLDEHNDTVRRSSRLYPVFQRVKRELIADISNAKMSTEAPSANMEYSPYAALSDYESQLTASDSPAGSSFIANLADNVKFSADIIEDVQLTDNNINNESNTNKKLHVPSFHVTYWMFYPYSQGKTMCTLSLGPLGRIPFPAVYGYCLGKRKDIGSHIGDWEHMSLYFNGETEPEAMYVSAHDAGAYYSYNRLTGSFEFKRQETRKGILQQPNFPKTVTTFNNHPVLFAAKGSHGLWTAPGKHRFVKVARLYDINGFGTPWNTWKAVDISFENLKSYGRSLVPDWLTFKGKWGNPKSRCHPFRRIGLNFCELADGPTGIPLKEPHFECGLSYH